MNQRSFVVSHALDCELWLTSSLELLEANIPRFAIYRLLKNRIALLEKADRNT
jgi:hypothetical protein